MKTFRSVSPTNLDAAVQALQRNPNAAVVGGGSDLLGMVKERLITPDTLVNLRAVEGMDEMRPTQAGMLIGGMVPLDTISRDPIVQRSYTVLAEAAGQVGTPQIRNAGTIAGNVLQRPWCWYYRNGFKCYKAGGNTCFSITGENEFHAILGGGPSFIVHPSDTAPALVALDAKFRIAGPDGARTVDAANFFLLPAEGPGRENVLAPNELLAEVLLPPANPALRSSYHKVLDRESWTHAVVSVAVAMIMDAPFCRAARIVLGGVAPIPWRVPDAEAMLAGQRVTEELVAEVAEKALEGARPLAKNGYKVPLAKAVVKRTLLAVALA